MLACCAAAVALALWTAPEAAIGQTTYAVVLGNQNFVVGSSTLRSGLFVRYGTDSVWRHVGPENLKAYDMAAVDSTNGRILFIAAGDGVHRSTDYGRSWKIVTDWRMTEVLDVEVDQKAPRYVYAATAFGFWRSTDGGDTWENPHISEPERKPDTSNGAHRYYYRLFVDGGNGRIGLADDRLRQRATFVSTDRGETWRVEPAVAGDDGRDNAYDYCTLVNDVGAAVTAYVDRSGLHFTADRKTAPTDALRTDFPSGSIAGKPVESPSVHPVHTLALFRTGVHAVLLAGTFGDGIYSWDGKRWRFEGLPGSQVWRIVCKEYTVPEEAGHAH